MKVKADFNKETLLLRRFRSQKGLKHSTKQDLVVEAFLSTEGHVDTQGLYDLLRKEGSRVGYATVWRTLKLLARAGLARAVRLGGRETRFEHLYAHPHHDHLVCLHCGRVVEFLEPGLEKLQDRMARRHHFQAENHSLIIYGLCPACR